MKKITLCVIAFFAFLWLSVEYKARCVSPEPKKAQLFNKLPKTDRPAKYLEFHAGIRTRDDETVPQYQQNYKWEELRKAKQHAAARRRIGRLKSNGVVKWVERGPGNVPGRTRALLNVPGDPSQNTWLAGSATGGIWRTSDGGATWLETSENFPALPISSFSGTSDGEIIYASTGEFVSSVYSAIGNGIFKSADKGYTWQQVAATNNHPDFSVVTRLITNPADGKVIVATTVPHNLSIDKTSAIMRSADGGITWAKVKEINGILEQVIASPQNFNVQYVSQNGVGVWKSLDAGLTWELSNDGMAVNGRVEISVSPVDPDKLFASAEGTVSGTNSDLYYSDDAGASWSIVDVRFNNQAVDFLEGQGFYDNTVLCDPFNATKVYFGGVSLFRATLGSITSVMDHWAIREKQTSEFIFLQSFQNIEWDNARLAVGASKPKMVVQLRFGPGKEQNAHRFFVPAGATSSVAASNYTYQDYVRIPLEAWDITVPSNPRQLMISFRDQNRNGFDLVPQRLSDTDPPSTHSREYLYIHTLSYNASAPADAIAVNGGHENDLAYNIFPALAEGASWPATFPDSQVEIRYTTISKYSSSTVTSADGRGIFDNKNKADQIELDKGVHPDHHYMIPIVIDAAAKSYKLLLANDGGVFVSKVSANPGILEGDWQFKGNGYNTGQFYGADKRAGRDQYIGGLQDNGTRISPAEKPADAGTAYSFAIGGDGFEVLWNNKDDEQILGSVYYGQISRTTNGGASWSTATSGLSPTAAEFPFVTKLANSKDFPDRVFTVGSKGVYVSNDFGGNWTLTPIPDEFVTGSGFYLDVEVSRANANIVWAGSGMTNSGSALRYLHVSKDGGKTFAPTKNYATATLGNITKLASHPIDENTAFAIFSFQGSPKILQTNDLGQTWEDISGFENGAGTRGFPDVAVYCLYVRPDNPDIIWAGTEIGIVESTDNGESWALIEEFPNVSVWDMKGQDNQVVIATHGRGIWTANLEADQVTGKSPVIIASGTSPTGDLALRIQSPEAFDSLLVLVDVNASKTFFDVVPGTMDLSLANIASGSKNIRMVAYKGKVPYQSGSQSIYYVGLLPAQNNYSTYFNTLNDLHVTGLSLVAFGGKTQQRRSLQTTHDYETNAVYELFIRTPIRVSASMPILYYSDIGIVEPANDSIVVEATRNGLDWVALAPGYDAGFGGDAGSAWKSAYLSNRPANAAMFLKHEIEYGDKFNAGDLILFRFRLISGPAVTAWGWALDYVSIQEVPLSEEPAPPGDVSLVVFPNPTTGKATIDYTLKKPSDISVKIIDLSGKSFGPVLHDARTAGYHSEEIDLAAVPQGTYVIILQSSEGRMVGRVSIVR